MTKHLYIPSDVLTDLVARHPFHEIARMYDCDPRAVSALARLYGVTSAFAVKHATTEELARLQELAAEGWSLKRIADALGRSQDFVYQHRRRLEGAEAAAPYVRPSRTSWPKPETMAAEALDGRRYEDVDEDVLCREWPPWRFPVNGAALASAAQAANRSYSRSSADLCVEFANT